MIGFLTDEDFNHDIVRGLARRIAGLDLVRVQDIGLRGAVSVRIVASCPQPGATALG
jgi:hypothetical protein